jgi:chaperonin GroEL
VLKILKLNHRLLEHERKIEQVATISANNDNAIGKLIAEAFTKLVKKVLSLLKKQKVLILMLM